MPLLRRSPDQTTSQKVAAGQYWGVVAVVCIGGSILLAWKGSWGWLLVGIPVGVWAARRTLMYTREVDRDQTV